MVDLGSSFRVCEPGSVVGTQGAIGTYIFPVVTLEMGRQFLFF